MINNDDWDNVSMDVRSNNVRAVNFLSLECLFSLKTQVLKPYNLMDWNKKVVWGLWKARDLAFYENRRRSVGAEIPRPPPLFIQKDV